MVSYAVDLRYSTTQSVLYQHETMPAYVCFGKALGKTSEFNDDHPCGHRHSYLICGGEIMELLELAQLVWCLMQCSVRGWAKGSRSRAVSGRVLREWLPNTNGELKNYRLCGLTWPSVFVLVLPSERKTKKINNPVCFVVFVLLLLLLLLDSLCI